MEDFKPWMNKKKTKVVYQGISDHLDLTGISSFPSLERISVYDAKRVLLPENHDWSGVSTLEFSWEPQWAEVLEQRSATETLIYRPTQEALDCFNCELPTSEEGISSLSLSTIKHGVIDRWFPQAFSASWVKIVNSRTVDLSSAGPFNSIGLLDFRYVTRLSGLAHFTHQGRVRAIRLEDPLIMDPKEFWNIRTECIKFGTGRKENDAWLEEIWEQRPKNWEEKYFISSKFVNKKLGRTTWEETSQLSQAADDKAIAYRFKAAMKG
ncbi:hypothetical protein D3791_00195 [Glutamicibacter mishrai]|uniref:Uncharacterized protein n=2 Tax=Glutamicibacter mishrai TaxID=1775880 RepID=A0A6H0SGX1_9MICC|nr:hypothetical protein D3791_00195 [Glutamicibacter mishrai]